jgi:hypothetical protein
MVYPSSLQKAEEAVKKAEDFYSRDDPMTEIDKVRGVEHAYYDEKVFKEAEEAIAKLEEEARFPCPTCKKPLPTDPEKRTHHVSQHGAETGDFATKRTPFTAPEDIPMREEEVTPLDAGMVKQALDKAFVDASDLVKGIEEFVKDVETLDMSKIDSAIELINNISETLKDAKEMGYPIEEDSGSYGVETWTPRAGRGEEEPKKGEA